VIAEQRPDCSEEESFQWMSRVLQAVDSIHQVGIYCLALVPPNHLPKTPLGGIHLCEARRRFLEGSLHPANVLMCPHTCVTNLPKPRDLHQGKTPICLSQYSCLTRLIVIVEKVQIIRYLIFKKITKMQVAYNSLQL
jgi:hypothetical protein